MAKKAITHEDVQLMTTKQAASALGVAVRTMIDWRQLRKGPAYVKVGRVVRYRPSDIKVWVDQHVVEPMFA